MLGFHGERDATRPIDSDDGLHTGDIRALDNRGFLRLAGRVEIVIVRGGINLNSADIEAVITDHPAIEIAAVIGAPGPT